jgi:hypothetical protein
MSLDFSLELNPVDLRIYMQSELVDRSFPTEDEISSAQNYLFCKIQIITNDLLVLAQALIQEKALCRRSSSFVNLSEETSKFFIEAGSPYSKSKMHRIKLQRETDRYVKDSLFSQIKARAFKERISLNSAVRLSHLAKSIEVPSLQDLEFLETLGPESLILDKKIIFSSELIEEELVKAKRYVEECSFSPDDLYFSEHEQSFKLLNLLVGCVVGAVFSSGIFVEKKAQVLFGLSDLYQDEDVEVERDLRIRGRVCKVIAPHVKSEIVFIYNEMLRNHAHLLRSLK